MLAIVVQAPGGPDQLRLEEVPDPTPGPGEALLAVHATAVNRADLLQRQGLYPPPAGASPYLGLECAGVVVGVGPDTVLPHGLAVGDPVCALLAGGGYAELVAVPAGQLLPLPAGCDLTSAAALPEVAATVWSNVVDVARLQAGETLLVHGGASGIGTHAIQVAAARGADVLVTAGSADRVAQCVALGARAGVDYRTADFEAAVATLTDGRGVDVILDIVGGRYLEPNVRCLADGGRLLVIGLQGGVSGTLPLASLLAKRGAVHATALRSRAVPDKARICRGVAAEIWPLLAAGSVRPVVDRVLTLADAAEAHRLVADSGHVGKVVLAVAAHG